MKNCELQLDYKSCIIYYYILTGLFYGSDTFEFET